MVAAGGARCLGPRCTGDPSAALLPFQLDPGAGPLRAVAQGHPGHRIVLTRSLSSLLERDEVFKDSRTRSRRGRGSGNGVEPSIRHWSRGRSPSSCHKKGWTRPCTGFATTFGHWRGMDGRQIAPPRGRSASWYHWASAFLQEQRSPEMGQPNGDSTGRGAPAGALGQGTAGSALHGRPWREAPGEEAIDEGTAFSAVPGLG